MWIMILPSIDGINWVQAIGVPESKDPDFAAAEVLEVIAEVRAENPDDWGWEDVQARLFKRGYEVVEHFYGPVWDE